MTKTPKISEDLEFEMTSEDLAALGRREVAYVRSIDVDQVKDMIGDDADDHEEDHPDRGQGEQDDLDERVVSHERLLQPEVSTAVHQRDNHEVGAELQSGGPPRQHDLVAAEGRITGAALRPQEDRVLDHRVLHV